MGSIPGPSKNAIFLFSCYICSAPLVQASPIRLQRLAIQMSIRWIQRSSSEGLPKSLVKVQRWIQEGQRGPLLLGPKDAIGTPPIADYQAHCSLFFILLYFLLFKLFY